jgi:methylmalonyl-CoA mutase cobalamin-binding subunit
MLRAITPRQLADAIGVSESSLKRWADAGRIQVSRTEGGHRRITLTEAVRFIRDSRALVVRPEILGLPAANDDQDVTLTKMLLGGDGRGVTGYLLARFLAGSSVAALCDGPLRAALSHIGTLWRHAEQGVMVEHRATAILIESLGALRALIQDPPGAPVAVGGGLAADPYVIPSMMCATALSEIGMRPVNLGADTPGSALVQAVRDERAQLVWISVTAPPSETALAELGGVCRELVALGVPVVVGGRQREGLTLPPEVRVAGTIGELTAVVEELRLVPRRPLSRSLMTDAD